MSPGELGGLGRIGAPLPVGQGIAPWQGPFDNGHSLLGAATHGVSRSGAGAPNRTRRPGLCELDRGEGARIGCGLLLPPVVEEHARVDGDGCESHEDQHRDSHENRSCPPVLVGEKPPCSTDGHAHEYVPFDQSGVCSIRISTVDSSSERPENTQSRIPVSVLS